LINIPLNERGTFKQNEEKSTKRKVMEATKPEQEEE